MGLHGPVTRPSYGLSITPPAFKVSHAPSPPPSPGTQARNGYQFPHQKLPQSSRLAVGGAHAPHDAAHTKRTATSPSRTTAPLFPDEVMPNLYISDLETASAILSPNWAAPGRPKIKYILSVLDNMADQPKIVDVTDTNNRVLKLIMLNDWCDVDMIQHLPEARDFIRSSLAANDGGVLVHCRQGVSRSGSVIVAYVMESLGLTYDAAMVHVRKSRMKVHPNVGFEQQLKLWETLKYELNDADGHEKDIYRDWKKNTKLRTSIGRY